MPIPILPPLPSRLLKLFLTSLPSAWWGISVLWTHIDLISSLTIDYWLSWQQNLPHLYPQTHLALSLAYSKYSIRLIYLSTLMYFSTFCLNSFFRPWVPEKSQITLLILVFRSSILIKWKPPCMWKDSCSLFVLFQSEPGPFTTREEKRGLSWN